MQITNIKQLNRKIVGRWVTVQWDDIGRRDALIVKINADGKITRNSSLTVYEPFDDEPRRISAGQITALGDHVKAPKFF